MGKLIKILSVIMAIAMLISCITGCSDSNNQENASNITPPIEESEGEGEYIPEVTSPPIVYPFTFEDNTGYSVTLEQEPLKVVTIGPDITEIMFCIGRGIQIEGRSEEDDYPYDVQDIPSIGSINNPDVEKIAEINPDVVIASDKVPTEKIAEIRNKQIPTVVVNTAQSFEEIYDTIRYIGRVLNAEIAAYSYVMEMQGKVSELLIYNAGNEKYDVCIVTEYFAETDTVATVASNENEYKYSAEILKTLRANSVDIDENPFYIICVGEELKIQITKSKALKDVSAVKMGRVRFIDEDILDIRSPRALNALYDVAEILGYQTEAPVTE